ARQDHARALRPLPGAERRDQGAGRPPEARARPGRGTRSPRRLARWLILLSPRPGHGGVGVSKPNEPEKTAWIKGLILRVGFAGGEYGMPGSSPEPTIAAAGR